MSAGGSNVDVVCVEAVYLMTSGSVSVCVSMDRVVGAGASGWSGSDVSSVCVECEICFVCVVGDGDGELLVELRDNLVELRDNLGELRNHLDEHATKC